MSNPYYVYSGNFIPGTLARAEAVATEYQAVQQGFNLLSYQGTDTGGANAYVVTTPYAPTAYTDGALVQFKAANSNTGAATINVNGIGAANLKRGTGTALVSGDIIAGAWYTAVYSTTFTAFLIIAPAQFTAFTGSISAAPPTNKVGLTAVGGSSTSAAPIDATYAIDQGIAPTWTNIHTFSAKPVFNAGVTVNQTASGVALTVTGLANSFAALINGSSTTGQSLGLKVSAGTNSSDAALLLNNQANTARLAEVRGDGSFTLGYNGSTDTLIGSSAGAIAINAPSSGISAVINSPTAQYAVQTNAQSGSWTGINLAVGEVSRWGLITDFNGTGVFSLYSATVGAVVEVTQSGNVSINAPSSGVPLTVNGAGDSSHGAIIAVAGPIEAEQAGVPQFVLNSVGANFGLLQNDAFGTWSLAYGPALNTLGTPVLKWNTNGNVTISAPSSGAGLIVNGVANSATAQIVAPNTTNQSFGLQIYGGTNSSDYGLQVTNAANATSYFRVRGDGLVQAVDDAGGFQTVGWRDCVQNAQTASYQLVLADRGKQVLMYGAGLTLTIPANGAVAFPIGTTILIVTSSTLTIAITTDTLILAGTSSTGSRTLATNGMATLTKTGSTTWLIGGAGLS